MPHIALIDSTNKFYNVVYEEDEKRRNYKVLAYLNQTGLIDYTQEKFCENGHLMTIKKSPKTDGWCWRCSPKGCQKTKSIRAGTFFLRNKCKYSFKNFLSQIIINFFRLEEFKKNRSYKSK